MSLRSGSTCFCVGATAPNAALFSRRLERRPGSAGERRDPAISTAPAARFAGVRTDNRSGEQATLAVRTTDGDTVTISSEALRRSQAGVYAARVEWAEATAETYSAKSSVAVRVAVEGRLDEEEATQIGNLLRRLVTTARADSTPPATAASGFGEIAGFAFANKAYERVRVSSLEAQAD